MSNHGHTKRRRAPDRSEPRELISIATTANAYGIADSRPVAPIPADEPALTIDGSQNTKP